MERLNELEQAVLDKLLAGDHPALAALRARARTARVAARTETGVGFFCDFEVGNSPEVPLRSTPIQARGEVLERSGIGVDDAANGVFSPARSASPDTA